MVQPDGADPAFFLFTLPIFLRPAAHFLRDSQPLCVLLVRRSGLPTIYVVSINVPRRDGRRPRASGRGARARTQARGRPGDLRQPFPSVC